MGWKPEIYIQQATHEEEEKGGVIWRNAVGKRK